MIWGKNMKKRWSALLLAAVLILGGCGQRRLYDFDLSKYITLGDYKGICYERLQDTVGEEELQNAINTDFKEHGYGTAQTLENGVIKSGDTVSLSYEGYLNGEKKSDISAENITITVGNGEYLEDFENGLADRNIGEEFSLQVSFPEDYIKVAYAGKTVEYKVVIHSATRMAYPKLDDEIAAQISDFTDVQSYKEAKIESLKKKKLEEENDRIEQEVWQKVVDAAEVKEYPKKQLETLADRCRQQFEQTAQNNQQTFSEYLKDNNITNEEFELYAQSYAKRYCKDEMVMYAIARNENLQASDAEIESLALKYADNYGYDSVKELYKAYDKALIEQTILYQKVKDFVVAQAMAK